MKPADLDDKIVDLMFQLSKIMHEEMKIDSKTAKLTFIQFRALLLIYKKETVSMGDIAESFGITLPTATVLCNRLAVMGLVKRLRNREDRRIVKLTLTEKGKKILSKGSKQRKEKIHHLLSYVQEKDKVRIFTILNNLCTNLKKTNEKKSC